MAGTAAARVSETEQEDRLILAEFLPYRLSIVAERVSRAFAARYEAEFGLTIPEWRVMAVLGERAPRSTQEVIETTEMDRVKVSRAVIRLADKGLLARTALRGDARAQQLRHTARGAAMYRRIVPLAHRLHGELVCRLAPEEIAVLESILTKLRTASGG